MRTGRAGKSDSAGAALADVHAIANTAPRGNAAHRLAEIMTPPVRFELWLVGYAIASPTRRLYMPRPIAFAIAALIATAAALPVCAQQYPVKPIRIIVA